MDIYGRRIDGPQATEADIRAVQNSGHTDVVWHARGTKLVPFVPLTGHLRGAVDLSERKRLLTRAEFEAMRPDARYEYLRAMWDGREGFRLVALAQQQAGAVDPSEAERLRAALAVVEAAQLRGEVPASVIRDVREALTRPAKKVN